MSTYSASFNFPNGFLWGISMPDDFIREKEYSPILYHLRENGMQAVSITLEWADFEPLKGNYEETLIESTRTLLSRIRNRNLEVIVTLKTAAVPQWQNLEHVTKKTFFSNEKYNFAAHIADALVPYTNYFCLSISDKALFTDKELKTELETQTSIREYILSLNSSAKVGIMFSRGAFTKRNSGFPALFHSLNRNALKKTTADFLAVSAEKIDYDGIRGVFGKERKPLMILPDCIRNSQSQDRFEVLIDKVYDMWNFYQEGWNLLGYLSNLDAQEDSEAFSLFSKTAKNNALEISSADENLPDKWIRFLKD